VSFADSGVDAFGRCARRSGAPDSSDGRRTKNNVGSSIMTASDVSPRETGGAESGKIFAHLPEDETRMETPTLRPERRRPRLWMVILVMSLVVVPLAAVAWLFVFATNFADTYGPYPRIENRTDETLVIFLEERDGERLRLIEVPPHSTTDLPSNCAAGELVAVTQDGKEVARRPRSQECNLRDWTIGGPEQ